MLAPPLPQPGLTPLILGMPVVTKIPSATKKTRPAPLMPGRFSLYGFGVSETSRFDANGIPQIKPWSNPDTWYYSPTVTAQWGLAAYVSGDDATVIKAADWLVQYQDSNGGFPFAFTHAAAGAYNLTAPWYSAISHGNAISLLIRTWAITGRSVYRISAQKALLLFQKPVSQGGLQGKLHDLPWFEETPDPTWPNHIFNGHVFALLGIHDLATIGSDPNAEKLWRLGEFSLRTNLRYDYPSGWFVTRPMPLGLPSYTPNLWMVYDLPVKGSNGIPDTPHFVTSFYAQVHIDLLHEMAHRVDGVHQQYYVKLASKLEKNLKEWQASGGS